MPPRSGNDEVRQIQKIIACLNDPSSSVGQKIKAALKMKLGLEITDARARTGSNRGTHYDFEVLIDGQWKKIEHKGCLKYHVPKADEKPWAGGVQFYNGGCEKFNFTKKYAKVWYDMYIGSGTFKNEFGIQAPIPPFEEWYQSDCRVQDNPKTPFGKELKTKVRSGPKKSLLDKRLSVNKVLVFTPEDEKVLKDQVLNIVKDVLDQKELWLSIYGNLDGDFHAEWYPKMEVPSIDTVVIKQGTLDFEMDFLCPGGFQFRGILRWGKGAGFSNLRVDLK
jgi:hypothetical protein